MTVFDTDVLIDAMKGVRAAANGLRRAARRREFAVTCVQVFELHQGVRSKPERHDVEALLGVARILPIDAAAAVIAGACGSELRRARNSIPAADLLTAGVCIARRTSLCTRNVRHFSRIAGLRIVSQVEEE
jgi:predicted nucleic acid-binding protein